LVFIYIHDRQMHSCLGLLCRVSIIWSVCAREVSEVRLACECFYAGLSSSFPALHLLIGMWWCNLFDLVGWASPVDLLSVFER
jgi:hypothetical protein